MPKSLWLFVFFHCLIFKEAYCAFGIKNSVIGLLHSCESEVSFYFFLIVNFSFYLVNQIVCAIFLVKYCIRSNQWSFGL